MKKKFEGTLEGMAVVLVMGGPGKEREVSIRSGTAVARALEACEARVTVLDVTGSEDIRLPAGTQLVYNMIHGTFGEDGQLQSFLDRMGMPYTGEGATASRMAFDKIETKAAFEKNGVPTCAWQVHLRGNDARFPLPCVIKAPLQGSSVGVHIVRSAEEVEPALNDCFQYGERVLVEEFFQGRELTVGVLGDEALPIVEIVPHDGFYDYEHKYTRGASEYHVPAKLDPRTTQAVQEAALAACRALGLCVYSRVDVLLSPAGELNVLEINTIPGMTETSLLPKAAAVAGLDFSGLCEEIAGLSLARHHA